jgi:hypothetical protein
MTAAKAFAALLEEGLITAAPGFVKVRLLVISR